MPIAAAAGQLSPKHYGFAATTDAIHIVAACLRKLIVKTFGMFQSESTHAFIV